MSGHAGYWHRQKSSELSTSSNQINTHTLFRRQLQWFICLEPTAIVRQNCPRPRHLFRSTDVHSAHCFALPFTLLRHIRTLRVGGIGTLLVRLSDENSISVRGGQHANTTIAAAIHHSSGGKYNRHIGRTARRGKILDIGHTDCSKEVTLCRGC